MENSCYHCGKTVLYGRTHTHHRGVAGGRWKKRAPKKQKIFRSNFVRLSIIENGLKKRIKMCAKCLKRVRKDMKDGKKPFVVLAAVKKEMNAKNKASKVAEEAKTEVRATLKKTSSKK